MLHDKLTDTETPMWLTDEQYEGLRRAFGASDGEVFEVNTKSISLYLEPLEVARSKSQPPPESTNG
jgi:hypothetical protein